MLTESGQEKSVVRINIVGVGGGGNNVINRMVEASFPLVHTISVNTENCAIERAKAETVLQIGLKVSNGRGAGGNPNVGENSAREDSKKIEDAIKNCDMLFITAGMGGGTGTGAAPVISEIAHKLGILTVAVVTKPFPFEGKKRMKQAEIGIAKLEKYVDSLIVIPNENLKKISPGRITLYNAFALADDILMQTVKNIVEVIQQTAFINCDFADITSIIKDSGYMHVATGQVQNVDCVDKIISQLMSNKLLDSSVEDATGILLCITAPGDVGLEEIDKISSAVTDKASPNANVIFGMKFNEDVRDGLRAVLIATKSHKFIGKKDA